MSNSNEPQSLSTVRESYAPVTRLEQVPVALLESLEIATSSCTDPRLESMLQSIVDLMLGDPDRFANAAMGGVSER